jgi:hypothetical protein
MMKISKRNRLLLLLLLVMMMVRVYGLSTACASVSVWRRAAMRSCPEAETICIS